MSDAAPDSPRTGPRWSTRDLIAPTAFFLGALLLAAAVAMGPIIGPGLRKLPLSVDQTWIADSSDDTTVLDRCSIDSPAARVLEAHLQQRRRTVAVRPSDSDVVTLQAATALGVDSYLVDGRAQDAERVCAEPTLAATIDRVTVNRVTASPTGRSEIQYDDKHAAVAVPDRRGRTYALPYGFDDPGDYFDVTTRQTVPLQAAGETEIDGRRVVRLRAVIPDTDLGALGTDPRGVITRPASWFGTFPGVAPSRRLTASLHHRATRDLFVDTATGVVVDERIEIEEEYRFAPGEAGSNPALTGFRLPNLSTVLTGDRHSRIDGADAARHRARPVTLVTRTLPVALGAVGVLALIGGAVYVYRTGVRNGREDDGVRKR
ncbi:porin PorA family protein [Gordonia sp. PS3]|uniref:porin PorA family protein n=1 Tax=Gordonia TaxID=2053 RepID=UPI002415BC0F|nr:porin PorA family protein [Gordonia sihwensis]WFN93105.1 porin PorA family protein [Gordonia sihwensis]